MGSLLLLSCRFSFVCPTELSDLQEQYEALKSLGVEICSVSTVPHFVHKAWHDDSQMLLELLLGSMIGDPSHHISQGFDVLGQRWSRATWYIHY